MPVRTWNMMASIGLSSAVTSSGKTSVIQKTMTRAMTAASRRPSRVRPFERQQEQQPRFGLLVDAEWTAREQRKLQRRLRTAMERPGRRLARRRVARPQRRRYQACDCRSCWGRACR